MDTRKMKVPFGLLFEEVVPQPQSLVIPIYDEDNDLSYTEDLDGRRVPIVELTGMIGTETTTRVSWESTDSDE